MAATEHGAPEVLEGLIRQAVGSGASDVHLHMDGQRARVAFRLDGVLAPATELPEGVARRVVGRIKYLARLKTYQETLPQDGRIDHGDVGSGSDIRVSTYPTVTGEKIVLRLFSAAEVMTLAQLGFPDAARAELEGFLAQPSGMALLTGPAGSGKTTTIYACLRHLAGCEPRAASHEPKTPGAQTGGLVARGSPLAVSARHIITIEDPAEQVIEGVMQTEVNAAAGLTFAKAARHLLRQDPQVLVVGEIRDEETANLAVRAAFTGHLVISTLHAGSCRGVFERLFDMCDDRYAAVAAVGLVLSQRLVRRLCSECHGEGCGACLGTGYRGRTPAVEWLRVDDAVRAALRERGPSAVEPAEPLEAAGRRLVAEGVTDEPELARVLGT